MSSKGDRTARSKTKTEIELVKARSCTFLNDKREESVKRYTTLRNHLLGVDVSAEVTPGKKGASYTAKEGGPDGWSGGPLGTKQ